MLWGGREEGGGASHRHCLEVYHCRRVELCRGTAGFLDEVLAETGESNYWR